MSFAVSVILPLRNEEKAIARLLRSLQAQALPPDEIVCVDGGSTDDTVATIEGNDWGSVPVRVLRAGPSFPGRGRNLGTASARNDWIAYTDGGIETRPDWIAELVTHVRQNPEVKAVFGNFEPRVDSFFTECAATAYVRTRRHGDAPYRGPSIASCLVARSVWEHVGRFEEDLRSGEDLVFIERVLRSARVSFAPSASVVWELAPDWRGTFARFRTYSKSGIDAGKFRDWHSRMLARYGLIGLAAFSPLVLGVASAWIAPAMLVGLLVARAGLAVWRDRGRVLCFTKNPVTRVLGTVFVLTAVDLGLLLGTFDWIRARFWRRPSQPQGPKQVAPGA